MPSPVPRRAARHDSDKVHPEYVLEGADGSGEVFAAAAGTDAAGTDAADLDRDRMMNDLANTGVVAALFGGFSLANMQIDLSAYGAGKDGTSELVRQTGLMLWFISFVSAHVCTLSAAGSALLYRKVNMLSDADAQAWRLQNHRVFKVYGCVCVCA